MKKWFDAIIRSIAENVANYIVMGMADHCWDRFTNELKPYLLTKQEEETYIGVPSQARMIDLIDIYREIVGEISSLHRRMDSLCLANSKVIREIRSKKRKRRVRK